MTENSAQSAIHELERGVEPSVLADLGFPEVGTDADDSNDFDAHSEKVLARYTGALSDLEKSEDDRNELLALAKLDVETGLITEDDYTALKELADIAESTKRYNRYMRQLGAIDNIFELNRIYKSLIVEDHKIGLLRDDHFEQLKAYVPIREQYLKYMQSPDSEPDHMQRAAGKD